MRGRAILIFGAAILLAIAAVFLTRSWLQRQIQTASVHQPAPIAKTTIVVARQTLYYGNTLSRDKVKEIPWLAGDLPQGAFRTTDDLFKDNKDRVVLRTIEKNEAILSTKISGDKTAAFLSATIDKKMRAITVRVNDVVGVAGFVIPGDHVDIILTRQGQNKRPVSTLLLQNIKVLGIDQQASEDQKGPKVVKAVTIEVTPQQAEKIALATTVGALKLALRNRGSSDIVLASLVTEGDLGVGEALVSVDSDKNGKATQKIVATRKESRTGVPIEVTRGIKVYRYNVSRDDGTVAAVETPKSKPAGDSEKAASENGEGGTPASGSGAKPESGSSAGGAAANKEPSNEPRSLLPKDQVNF